MQIFERIRQRLSSSKKKADYSTGYQSAKGGGMNGCILSQDAIDFLNRIVLFYAEDGNPYFMIDAQMVAINFICATTKEAQDQIHNSLKGRHPKANGPLPSEGRGA